jgi:YD repeat-containing protein
VTLFNARLKAARTLNPFFTTRTGNLAELLAFEDVEAPGWQGLFPNGANLAPLDLVTAHQSSTEYDATLRAVKSINSDGTFARTEFEPLVTRAFDETTPIRLTAFQYAMLRFADGLGRLIQVNELVRLNDDGLPSGTLNAWTTRYQYDLNGQLTRIIDSQNNVKELRYDG